MTAGGLSYQQIEAMVAAVREHGIKGLEDAIEWRQFDFEALQQMHGVFVQVDANLYRSLELAKRQGDEMRVKTVQALGVGDGKIDEPFSIRIAPGTLAAQRRAIFYKAVDEEDKVKASKLLAMLALRGHTQSRNNLGFRFHFGMGVPEDYDLAIYWHTLAARAGDAYAMTNLGKIYSTKDSPKWDGPKAVKWFEKATAKGETWAMGELGHCLLCRKCAGKDVARARSLLEKAVAANPDRGDFVEELDRARDDAE
jgi:TPR repeat protein